MTRSTLLLSVMAVHSSAIEAPAPPLSLVSPPSRSGLWWGAAGILAFSWTLPLTKVAINGGLHPALVGYGRAVVPGVLAILLLVATRQRLPRGRQWAGVAVVAAGGVVGFPILTSLAMQTVPASHSAVVVGLLPLVTAAFSALRTGERPPALFWAASGIGAVAVVVFVGLGKGGLGNVGVGDLYLLAAVIACALGYMEGGVLSRALGAWQTICWALVVALLPMTVLTLVETPDIVAELGGAGTTPIVAFAYLAVVSTFLGYFAWYRGLGIGPATRVSQVQLVQPMVTVGWSVLVLGERPGLVILVGGGVVLFAATVAVRVRQRVTA
jgi:drug/metabolite transporter (DMT)-like permease